MASLSISNELEILACRAINLPDTDCVENEADEAFLSASFLDLLCQIELIDIIRMVLGKIESRYIQGASCKGCL